MTVPVLTAPAALTEGQRGVLARALADAVTYRRGDDAEDCAACEAEDDGGLCPDCTLDRLLAASYTALGRELGLGACP